MIGFELMVLFRPLSGYLKSALISFWQQVILLVQCVAAVCAWRVVAVPCIVLTPHTIYKAFAAIVIRAVTTPWSDIFLTFKFYEHITVIRYIFSSFFAVKIVSYSKVWCLILQPRLYYYENNVSLNYDWMKYYWILSAGWKLNDDVMYQLAVGSSPELKYWNTGNHKTKQFIFPFFTHL